MAEAGSVAPVFRDGGYDETAIYDFYHAIIYNNKLYFCRQDGTIGHEPQEESDEYWFLSIDGNIVDASTLNGKSESELSVANSEQLGGKGASDYALAQQIKDNSIWNELTEGFDLNNAFGKYRTASGAIIKTLLNLPSAWTSGELAVEYIPFNSANTYGVQTLIYKSSSTVSVHQRAKKSGEWGEWFTPFATTADLANYLPKNSDGSVGSGVVSLTLKGDPTASIIRFLNSEGKNFGALGIWGSADKLIFRTSTNDNRDILHSGNVGSYALPIGGGTITNAILTPLSVNNSHADATGTYIGFLLRGVAQGYIGVANGALKFTKDGIAYDLHHDGNSAKVVQATSAPSDTTAVWVDTANKKVKAYIDGAWTVIA